VKLQLLGFAVGLSVAAATAASAAPIQTMFTWNPAGASNNLNGGSVTADNITIADFASETIDPTTGAFTEVGVLKIAGFLNGGSGVSAPGLNATNGYSLYLTYTASGNQGGPLPTTPGTTISGSINSISYTLWGNPHGNPTFTVHNGSVTIANNKGAVPLAVGSGGGSLTDFATLTYTGKAYIPSAQAITTFQACTGVGGGCTGDESGFFTSPPASMMLDLEIALTNTARVSTTHKGTPTFINISGGGGNLDLLRTPVPEPATLALLGAGLLGLGVVRRKQVRHQQG
jgi:hypothetical protein